MTTYETIIFYVNQSKTEKNVKSKTTLLNFLHFWSTSQLEETGKREKERERIGKKKKRKHLFNLEYSRFTTLY